MNILIMRKVAFTAAANRIKNISERLGRLHTRMFHSRLPEAYRTHPDWFTEKCLGVGLSPAVVLSCSAAFSPKKPIPCPGKT